MRLNLLAGSGCGKSVLAAKLFAALKQRGVNIELVTEYIKSWAYEQRVPTSYDQLYIFSKQLHAEDILLRRGVHIVTDSPLLLQLIYAKRYKCPFYTEILAICRKFDATHPSLNYILKRSVDFNPEGRFEATVDDAIAVDNEIREFMATYNPVDTSYTIDPKIINVDSLANSIKSFCNL